MPKLLLFLENSCADYSVIIQKRKHPYSIEIPEGSPAEQYSALLYSVQAYFRVKNGELRTFDRNDTDGPELSTLLHWPKRCILTNWRARGISVTVVIRNGLLGKNIRDLTLLEIMNWEDFKSDIRQQFGLTYSQELWLFSTSMEASSSLTEVQDVAGLSSFDDRNTLICWTDQPTEWSKKYTRWLLSEYLATDPSDATSSSNQSHWWWPSWLHGVRRYIPSIRYTTPRWAQSAEGGGSWNPKNWMRRNRASSTTDNLASQTRSWFPVRSRSASAPDLTQMPPSQGGMQGAYQTFVPAYLNNLSSATSMWHSAPGDGNAPDQPETSTKKKKNKTKKKKRKNQQQHHVSVDDDDDDEDGDNPERPVLMDDDDWATNNCMIDMDEPPQQKPKGYKKMLSQVQSGAKSMKNVGTKLNPFGKKKSRYHALDSDNEEHDDDDWTNALHHNSAASEPGCTPYQRGYEGCL
eukprot:TRINITY_DN104834_c0_g1_i1.p1 TRINITY_DN104834_c0_g1~~TRINITY_DN104834_c0_g1_i1.p1  ORF type:complete len:463 (-),score=39.92 TRINITY_DN104834_c0_g1_i1:58-1446(-)